MFVSENNARENLADFVLFCQRLRGNERQESQTFLDRLFRAFGHQGAIEAGAEFESTLSKGSKSGGTGFADLVWRSRSGTPGVVIEMKSRGEDLSKHYAQVERYWMRIAPNRPRYAMLCNFDEFWIFDFENQVDEPIDRLVIDETLPERARALSFLVIGGQPPIFNNNQVEVTERNARRMGELYQELYKRGKQQGFQDFNEEQLQRFILQCVMAMFAEDRGLLPDDLFVSLVQDCLKGSSSYDLFSGLFQAMNQKGITPAGRYKGVQYFNGGLFSTIDAIELTLEELKFLDICARENWSNIRPSIFGNIFEGAIDPVKRHAHGIHFTSEVDIRQIVRPTISDYWEERINAANTIGELNRLQMEIQSYRVLDPACGCGNFLYVAYQEMKRLEKLLLDRVAERRRSDVGQMQMGYVTPLQFFGMDTNPFAVQLARVTMMIARKIAIDKYNLDEPVLPLDTLDSNIVCQDALFTEWTRADAVIGNPPFLGGHRLRLELGDEYAERVFKEFPEVKDKVDFCGYWFRLAHENLNGKGRAGLVGTNSITQGITRKATLDYITQSGGVIHEAISTQPWSGQANVHVSIVNWGYEQPRTYHLDQKLVLRINSSLKADTDVSEAFRLQANMGISFKGIQPSGKGFFVTKQQVEAWINENVKNKQVLKEFLSATDLTDIPNGKPTRWIIDFCDLLIEDASQFKRPFSHVLEMVKPERERNRREATKFAWWQFGEKRPAMRRAITSLACFFTVPRHSKWFVFTPTLLQYLPGDSTAVIASDDFYILGILTSNTHRRWVKAQASTLEDRTRYTSTTCFETFPFPQSPKPKLVDQIRSVALEIHQYRTEQMEKRQWGITQLYNQFFNEPSSQLYKLHSKLNALVLQAYGFSTNDDILAKLLKLNLELSEREKQGLPVVGPCAPNG